MINQNRSYRIFRPTVIFADRDTGLVVTTETTVDLGDVGSFEKYPYDSFKQHGECVTLYFTNNKPPITIKYKYKAFCDLHDNYLLDMQALDARSQKKTLNYKGMMKPFFSKSDKYFVTTFYPQNYIFRGASERDTMDAILLNEIRPMS